VIRDLLVAFALLAGGAAVLPHVPLRAPDTPAPAAFTSPAGDIVEITAAHEAGHVAALHELGIPVWRVEVHTDGSGETAYPDDLSAHDYAVVDVAGQESAAAWLVGHRGYTQEDALAVTESSASSDLANLRADAARAGISEAQARQRARVIVHNRHADIDRVAQQIIENGGSLNRRDLERKDN
jgi:hypothetical protein